MVASVITDLDELRQLLEHSSPRLPAKLSAMHTNGTPTASTAPTGYNTRVAPYNQALNVAERSVDRLGKAIEAAEEEMEAALRRTTEVHQSQLRQKEVELTEVHRVLATKERSIDSLRDTLATTKRSYEARMAQADSALAFKDAEIASLREELSTTTSERDALASQLQRQVAALERECDAYRQRETDLTQELRTRTDEAARHALTVRSERGDAARYQTQAADARRQAQLLSDELQVLRVESLSEKKRLESEVEALRTRLRMERGVRKACEKWLRSELKSREEMEVLLTAIREAAGAAPGRLEELTGRLETGNAGTAEEVRLLLDSLRMADAGALPAPLAAGQPALRRAASPGHSAGARLSAGALPGYTPHAAVSALEAQGRKVLEDNRRLQADLAAARRLLTEQLVK